MLLFTSLLAWATVLAGRAEAALELSPLLGEHMVLPVEGDRVSVEGRASPQERVEAMLGSKTARTQADAQGRWRLTWFASQVNRARASRPVTLRFVGPQRLLFRDVLLGEVWLAAGQSNMAMPTRQAEGGNELAEDAAAADLRFFRLDNESEDDLSRVHGHWERASIGEAARFSAVATSFGVTLKRGRRQAVGLVQAAWNATPIESWIRPQAWSAAGHASLQPATAPFPSEKVVQEFLAKRAAWVQAARFHDPGDAGLALGWAEPAFDDSSWSTQEVPGSFESHGLSLDGVVWLRRKVNLPASCVGHPLALSLGPIDDCDRTYVNGVLVGSTCHEVTDPYRVSRQYRVPASAVTSATLVLAVRVVDEIGDGGFTGLPAEMQVICDGRPNEPRDLQGSWRIHIEREAPRDRPGPNDGPPTPAGWPTPLTPGILADHWIAHLAPFRFNGVLWYQGENNLGQADRYASALEVWLRDWSAIFDRADLPVLLVQLPGHRGAASRSRASSTAWAQIREAQRGLARHPNVRLVVITDLGQGEQMHPTCKRPVGERAAWLAQHPAVPATGPWLREMIPGSGGATLTFDAQGSLHASDGTSLRGFHVVDREGREMPCTASANGNQVELSWSVPPAGAHDGEPNAMAPATIRYGYADEPDGTLTDDTGWPASPFEVRTERVEKR